jgi:hypothetical protein
MSHSKQPAYYRKPEKIKAREAVIKVYRELSGHQRIPQGYQYWTLCNRQPSHPDSEINQLARKAFLTKEQFYGVDYDLNNEGIIEKNCLDHPEANFFHGDWLEVIGTACEEDWFRPSLVYFDYTFTVANSKTANYFSDTLNMCREKNVVVAANVMISSGHSNKKYNATDFGNDVWNKIYEKSHWKRFELAYQYRASFTDMRTYWFHRIKD